MRLVRNHIVEYSDDLAVAPQSAADIAERRGKPTHPVAHDQQVRLPPAYLPHCPQIGKRIGRVKYGCTPHRHGLVVFGHLLRLTRKEKFGILP